MKKEYAEKLARLVGGEARALGSTEWQRDYFEVFLKTPDPDTALVLGSHGWEVTNGRGWALEESESD